MILALEALALKSLFLTLSLGALALRALVLEALTLALTQTLAIALRAPFPVPDSLVPCHGPGPGSLALGILAFWVLVLALTLALGTLALALALGTLALVLDLRSMALSLVYGLGPWLWPCP